MDVITKELKGRFLTITHCEDDPMSGSWRDAISHERRDPTRCAAQMLTRQKHLADTGRLRSPDHFNTEKKLPNGKHFYAIKAGQIRAYGWFGENCFVISHYVYKNSAKLDSADTAIVKANWKKYTEQHR